MDRPLVVLVHGLASGNPTMWPLAIWIRRAGFATRCFGYFSLFRGVPFHGARFRDFLNRMIAKNPDRDLHIVAHSLGGVITRQALLIERMPQVKRIVTLGTPHFGTPAATRLVKFGFGVIRTLADVADSPNSVASQLGDLTGIELGTITASYDFVIPQSCGKARDAKSHAHIFSGHNGLLVRPKAARLVVKFLKEGSFGQ